MSDSSDYANVHIETSLPRPWEEETSFNDVLYEWMSRAPWLAISAIAHVIVFLILMAIPWDLIYKQDEKEINAQIEQTPEEVFEDPPPEEPEEIEEEEIEEPVLQDAEVTEVVEEFEVTEGDPDFLSDSPFDDKAFNDVIGIGGGAGGKFGGRFGGKRNLKARGGSGTEQALKNGLEWLKNHQSLDGYWDVAAFMHNNSLGKSCSCDGPGQDIHNVGMTGLALLAFLGDGNTTRQGPYKDVVARGIKWLKDEQDPDSGLLGDRVGHGFIYDHAIATLAICEAYYFSKSPLIKKTAQEAINYIMRARNPYSAWRYEVPPDGTNDTSVTGWMVFALKSAEEGGLKIDKDAYAGALSWLDEVTDPATGRVGYDSPGSQSSRIDRVNDHYPRGKTEAMTAVGLLCRFFMGQDPDQTPMMKRHADLLLEALPDWTADGYSKDNCNDMYYWYYGSYAMYQMGGSKYWEPWNKAMKKAVLDSQRTDGDFLGSWDPNGPWGFSGGRVYSTASMVLCLEVYFRYAKVLGAR